MKDNNISRDDHIEEVLSQFDGANEDSYVYLTDENGSEYPFEFLDVITYEGEDYGIFFPATEEDDDSDEEEGVVILKVIPNEDGSADFITTDDTDKLDAVFDIFMENLRRQFELEESEAHEDDADAAGHSEK